MDPLSSLKMVGLPDFSGQVAAAAQQATASKPISVPDMEKLSPGLTLPAPDGVGSSGASFQNVLGGFIQEVSDKQAAAGQAVTGLLSGKNVSLHQAMISVEEASVSFQLMVEVRNRLLDSYQELMRMQV